MIWNLGFFFYFNLAYIFWKFSWTIYFINCFKIIWIWNQLFVFLKLFLVLHNNITFLIKVHFVNDIINLINLSMSYLLFIKYLLNLRKFLIQKLTIILLTQKPRFCTLLPSLNKLLDFWKSFLNFELKLFLFSFLGHLIFKINLNNCIYVTSFALNNQISFNFAHFPHMAYHIKLAILIWTFYIAIFMCIIYCVKYCAFRLVSCYFIYFLLIE